MIGFLSGETWEKISDHKGFAEGTLGIIGVTVSPVNPERVWAIVENKDQGGVYRSDDAGTSWTKVNESRALRQRAWYYTKIYADSQDVNGVYVMNVAYHHSTDGGKTFKAHRAPHGDHHDLWIAPEDNQRMIIADDGGAQVSYDGGTTWSTYHNQPTAQFYRVTTDNAPIASMLPSKTTLPFACATAALAVRLGKTIGKQPQEENRHISPLTPPTTILFTEEAMVVS